MLRALTDLLFRSWRHEVQWKAWNQQTGEPVFEVRIRDGVPVAAVVWIRREDGELVWFRNQMEGTSGVRLGKP